MNMQKKGQGLPLTTIILAILGILVLVILAAFLTSYFAQAPDNLQGCAVTGGTCFNNSDKSCYKSSLFAENGVDLDDQYRPTTSDTACPTERGHCCPAGYKVVNNP